MTHPTKHLQGCRYAETGRSEDCNCGYLENAPFTSKERSQRPQKTSACSHYNYLMDMARWCGIHWEISSMHVTAENAIMVAADQKDEIERLRAALDRVRDADSTKETFRIAVDALSGDSSAPEHNHPDGIAYYTDCPACNQKSPLETGNYGEGK